MADFFKLGSPSHRYCIGMEVCPRYEGISSSNRDPLTKCFVTPGRCSSEEYNLKMVSDNNINIDISVSGKGGIDNGAVETGVWYFVYVIGDSTGKNKISAVLSKSSVSPSMPKGYDSYRYVAPVKTRDDDEGNIVLADFSIVGSGTSRKFQYMNLLASRVFNETGTITSTTLSLDGFVAPNVLNTEVVLELSINTPTSGSLITFLPPFVEDSLLTRGVGVNSTIDGSAQYEQRTVYAIANEDEPTIRFSVVPAISGTVSMEIYSFSFDI